MNQEISISQYFDDYAAWPLVDVRSPGEYTEGHIIGALSIPLFSDDERAIVGTLYKQQSREAAVAMGRTYVQPKLQTFIDRTLQAAPTKDVIIHCWRGGMRSQAFAQHLRDNGFREVKTIIGGYKAYREYMRKTIARPYQLLVLSGYTGSGKTAILHALKEEGELILDLEGLANHKGSAFGAIGQFPQPSTEHFHNLVFEQLRNMPSDKRIWVEDEAVMIGKVNLPVTLYESMKGAPAMSLIMSRELRAGRLVLDYVGMGDDLLEDAILKIKKRMGGQHANRALELLKEKEYEEVAKLCLVYYDKYYQKSIEKRDPVTVHSLTTNTADPKLNAMELIISADQIKL